MGLGDLRSPGLGTTKKWDGPPSNDCQDLSCQTSLVRFTLVLDGLLGVAGIIIDSEI